ncbi:hypothetical protein J5N97_021334 [Dioscorea zingiberensis]|uniref:Uncharacterized protein n=1 Tax=Dioscorea zingiberensis TaxID=325984 RepID=A0A9D5CJN1_9LILI|nr:hypothetical protein J5N97_021334 [Dioscorea zingiberensis]
MASKSEKRRIRWTTKAHLRARLEKRRIRWTAMGAGFGILGGPTERDGSGASPVASVSCVASRLPCSSLLQLRRSLFPRHQWMEKHCCHWGENSQLFQFALFSVSRLSCSRCARRLPPCMFLSSLGIQTQATCVFGSGIALFYKEFIEALYQLFNGNASVTAIRHISHSRKDWECGRKFSLQEQIDHKEDFIKHELQISESPLVLVGHSSIYMF